MTHHDNNSYFTAGELANLFGVSKQTLIYYDKIDLLSPDYIGDNGYRHYSVKQYLDLEIIVNLRALNMSITDIKNHLDQRNKENFLDIINSKRIECENIIRENELIIKCLNAVYNKSTDKSTIIFYQPTLSIQEERLLRYTDVSEADDAKERITLFTNHSQKTFHNKKAIEKRVGWVITQDDLFINTVPNKTKAYFSFVTNAPAHRKTPKVILEPGLYLEIYFKGTYYANAAKLSEMIKNFIDANALTPVGDIYILPIENNLYYDEPEKFVNKIFLNVTRTN